VSCEACKKGKEAAEFDCVDKIAIRAGQLAGAAGATGAGQTAVSVVGGVAGGGLIYTGIAVLAGPPGWVAIGIGAIAVGAGAYGTYDGVRDAAGSAGILAQGKRAAEHLCKCAGK